MFWMPWRMHCLTDPDERAWAESTLLRVRASCAAIATSSSDIGVSSAPMPVIASPERLSLIEVDAVLDQRAHRAAHLLGAGDDDAEIEPRMRDVRGRGIAEAADRGDLRAGGEIARPGEAAFVDEALGDHVEPRLGGGGAAARR